MRASLATLRSSQKVQPVNYRKMQMQAARKDLDVIMQAHKDRAGLEKAVETVGEIDGARARGETKR